METIFYGIAGEGLGHATRAHAVISKLTNYRVEVFTFGDAYDFFLQKNYPYLNKINGLRFDFRDNKINPFYCLINFFKFIFSCPKSIKIIEDKAKDLKPKLFITDFEPLTPRVARDFKIPFISLDNQHRFVYCNLSTINEFFLKYCVFTIKVFTKILIPKPDVTIISTFHTNPTNDKNVHMVNVILSEEVANLKPQEEDFILVYDREPIGDKIVEELRNYKVKIYGKKEREGFNVCPLDAWKFKEDLVKCKAVICCAGNQLLGEAIYFGKPILTIPIPNQYEQEINAYFIETLGFGERSSLKEFSEEKVKKFLSQNFSKRNVENGLTKAVSIILNFLEGSYGRREAKS